MDQTHPQRRLSDKQPQFDSGFYLNEVIVLPASNEIIVFGKRIHVPPKPMQVLLYLVTNNARIVSSEELLQHVWKDDTQFENGGDEARKAHRKVSHAISELRNFLDDHKKHPEFIQTRPRQGYQIIAEMKPLDEHVHFSTQWPLRSPITQNPTQPDFVGSSSSSVTDTRWHYSWALLKSSKLFSVSIAFVISTWVLIQVLEVLFPIFGVPDWGMKLALLILVIGFPMVLLYTWLKEIKVRKHLFSRKNGGRRKTFFFRQLAVDFAFIGVLSIVVGYLAFYLLDSIESDQSEPKESSLATLDVKVDPHSIAILPFIVIGEGVPNYFSSTLHSELDSALSNNSIFKLVSSYAISDVNSDSPKILRERLGVSYLLNGRVSAPDEKIKIVITLTNTESLVQLWSITITDDNNSLLNIQKKLVAQITNALELVSNKTLLQNGRAIATDNVKAYDFYIQAKQQIANAKAIADYQQAEKLLLLSLKEDPNFLQASAALCQTSLEKYELGKAIEQFNAAQQNCLKVLSISPSDPESLVSMGHLLRIKGDYKDAVTYLQQALTKSKNYLPALSAMALVRQQLQHNEQAESLYQKIVSLEPGYWKHYSDYGDFLFSQGEYLNAANQYLKVTLLKPDNEQTFNRLGASYYLTNKFGEASKAWQRSLKLNPSANNYSNLGTAQFFEHRFNEAKINYQKALEFNKSDNVLWANLADAQKYSGSHSAARDSYFKALDLVNKRLSVNANDVMLLASQIRYLSEIGRCQDYDTKISSISQSANNDPYIYYDLSIAAKNCKNQRLAQKLIQVAINLGYSSQLLEQDIQFVELLPLPPTTETKKD